ncbi:MAG: hypothetical protein JWM09_1266 [Francisellaceae bacterium]|nr:hypothetical protein [Francisellaceae bacterium]
MIQIRKEALVPYKAEEMFDLVNNISAYPHFLKWCQKAQVSSQSEELVCASLWVGKGSFQYQFSTQNRIRRPELIEMNLIDGPFKHLQGFWIFEKLQDGCLIKFQVDFEFSNALLGFAFNSSMDSITMALMQSFCDQAKKIYG